MDIEKDEAGTQAAGMAKAKGDAGPVETAYGAGFAGESEECSGRFQQRAGRSPAQAFRAEPVAAVSVQPKDRLKQGRDGPGSVGLEEKISIFPAGTNSEMMASIGTSRNPHNLLWYRFANGAMAQSCSVS
jgi:hypothetical protein